MGENVIRLIDAVEGKRMSQQKPVAKIRHAPLTAPIIDIMQGADSFRIDIHEHGYVALRDVMPRLVPADRKTVDFAVVQAARTSFGHGLKTPEEDRGLLRYLMRSRHSTPFEFVELKFEMSLPIFVARQWIRHCTASVNEVSARYSVLPDHFYIPEHARGQSKTNKQGGEQVLSDEVTAELRKFLQATSTDAYAGYKDMLASDVSRELARLGLPMNVYTKWFWKCDLRNTLHLLSLRMDPHAQLEIREYADAMHALVSMVAPETVSAWEDYVYNAVTLTRLEVEALKEEIKNLRAPSVLRVSPSLQSSNARECAEWDAKKAKLGL